MVHYEFKVENNTLRISTSVSRAATRKKHQKRRENGILLKRSTHKNEKKSNNENMGQTESRSKRVKVDVNPALNAGAWSSLWTGNSIPYATIKSSHATTKDPGMPQL